MRLRSGIFACSGLHHTACCTTTHIELAIWLKNVFIELCTEVDTNHWQTSVSTILLQCCLSLTFPSPPPFTDKESLYSIVLLRAFVLYFYTLLLHPLKLFCVLSLLCFAVPEIRLQISPSQQFSIHTQLLLPFSRVTRRD